MFLEKYVFKTSEIGNGVFRLAARQSEQECSNVRALPAEKGKNASLFTKLPSRSRK